MGERNSGVGRARGLAVAMIGALGALVIGCAHHDDAAAKPAATTNGGEDLYRVTADATGFFRYGPQQPSGPDLSLKKETRVVMIKRSFGYSQVRTTDNQVGYVGTADITPLSAEELASERAAQAAALKPGKHLSVGGDYTIPPQAGAQEQLPAPEVKPTPNPAMFRY